MAVPNLVPLLGSISGMLAGPELAQRAAASLGIAGSPAGSLIAAASPKAIGAGIASLGAGAEVDEAVNQALRVTQGEMGAIGQPVAPGVMPPSTPPTGGMAPQPMPQGMPQQMPPQGMPQQPQPTMYNAFPQVQPPQSLGTGLGTLRPQQRPPMGSMTKGLV